MTPYFPVAGFAQAIVTTVPLSVAFPLTANSGCVVRKIPGIVTAGVIFTLALGALLASESKRRSGVRRAESYQRVQERLKRASQVIQDAWPYLYIPDIDIRQKMQTVETALDELEAFALTPEGRAEAEIWFLLGYGRYFANDFVRAERALQECLSRAPRHDSAHFFLGRLYLDRAMLSHMKLSQKQIGESTVIRDEFGSSPGTEEFWKLKAMLIATIQVRIEALDKALERRPHDAVAYCIRGITRPNDQTEESIADYSRAIEINPRMVEAYFNRAALLGESGRLDDALGDCDAMLRLDPSFFGAYFTRAQVWSRKGDFQRALSDLDVVVRGKALLPRALNDRGGMHLRLGNYEAAFKDFDEVIRLYPDLTEAYFNRGMAYRKLGDSKNALIDWDQFIRTNPKIAEVYTERGILRFHNSDLEGARDDFERSIQLKPSYQAYYHLAHIRWTLGDFTGAIADLNEAIRLNPSVAEAFHARGLSHHKVGDIQDAISDFEQALKLADPASPLGKVCAKALEELRQAGTD